MNINECGCRPYGWLGLDGNRCIRVIPRQLTQYYDTEEDSDSDSDSDISRPLSEASSVHSYQLRKKDTAMNNIVRRNDVFDTQQLEEYFKISKIYKKYGTSDRVNKTNWT